MITIPLISIKKQDIQYLVYPRVELITDCMSNKNGILEVLCMVMKGPEQLCPARFFNELSNDETYVIYRHILESLETKTTSTVSLNINTNFLNSHHVDMLLSEFGRSIIILELLETCSLQSTIQIQNRLNEIRENPKVHIWLDDFGSARSNFDVLSELNFDGVKMSKELFWDLYENDKILLKYLIKMIKRKSSTIVIEGVDSFDRYIFCKEQRCMMQGYFFNEIRNSAVC
ncbi:EAL domain-containing protein [Glaciecola sp. 33A]|jgi:EAL domain-containing protein (putative c-di-GMP-specific phosphodiesterase class I)|nr:EAL domain-containing protein [Glaciecola sp. 33A]